MMPNGLLRMFTVPIESFSVPNWDHWKPEILSNLTTGSTLAEVNSSGYGKFDDMESDYFDNNNSRTLPRYYDVVTEALQPVLDEFQESYPRDIQITSMWYQKTFSGQMHGVHNHGALGVSAAFYVEFDPLLHKPTTFYAPFHNFFNGDMVSYTPEVKEGDVVFFPSYLLHQQDPNKSPVIRTVVSFNIAGYTPVHHELQR